MSTSNQQDNAHFFCLKQKVNILPGLSCFPNIFAAEIVVGLANKDDKTFSCFSVMYCFPHEVIEAL